MAAAAEEVEGALDEGGMTDERVDEVSVGLLTECVLADANDLTLCASLAESGMGGGGE